MSLARPLQHYSHEMFLLLAFFVVNCRGRPPSSRTMFVAVARARAHKKAGGRTSPPPRRHVRRYASKRAARIRVVVLLLKRRRRPQSSLNDLACCAPRRSQCGRYSHLLTLCAIFCFEISHIIDGEFYCRALRNFQQPPRHRAVRRSAASVSLFSHSSQRPLAAAPTNFLFHRRLVFFLVAAADFFGTWRVANAREDNDGGDGGGDGGECFCCGARLVVALARRLTSRVARFEWRRRVERAPRLPNDGIFDGGRRIFTTRAPATLCVGRRLRHSATRS